MICHYLIHKGGKFPHEFMSLPKKEKAFITASMQVKGAEKKKEMEETKKMQNRGKGRKR